MSEQEQATTQVATETTTTAETTTSWWQRLFTWGNVKKVAKAVLPFAAGYAGGTLEKGEAIKKRRCVPVGSRAVGVLRRLPCL